MPTIVADLFIRTTVHFVHELYGLFFHQFSGMEVTLARNFHGTVAKTALYLLDVDSGFAQLSGVGVPEAVEVEFAVTQLGFDDEATKAEREKVAADIRQRGIRRREFERFITELEKLPEVVPEFDEALWGSLVEYVTVGKDKTMVFTLIGETEITA